MDDRLRFNFHYFQNQYKNKREQFVAPVTPTRLETVVANVARTETRGYELDFEYVPISNLYLRGGLSHYASDTKSFDIPDPDPANAGARLDLTALPVSYTPDQNLFLSARYSMDLYGGTLRAFAGYKRLGDYFTNNQLPNGEVFSFSTWDLALDYEWNDVTVRLFSHNVNDKRYIQNAARITDGHIGPHIAGATGATGLISYTEYNQPKITGVTLIFKPDVAGLLGR